jgi:hypothetical protein
LGGTIVSDLEKVLVIAGISPIASLAYPAVAVVCTLLGLIDLHPLIAMGVWTFAWAGAYPFMFVAAGIMLAVIVGASRVVSLSSPVWCVVFLFLGAVGSALMYVALRVWEPSFRFQGEEAVLFCPLGVLTMFLAFLMARYSRWCFPWLASKALNSEAA